MFNTKNYLLNCDICDTRKIKEEDYNGYEKMMINADVVIVSSSSKNILNRLPATINQDSTIEVPDDIDVEPQIVNGSYEITGTTAAMDHTLLIVNGTLNIHPHTEEVLKKYEKIHVNGSVKCPKSLEGYLTKLSANGSISIYPDDHVILDNLFIIDKYFPIRAKEGKKYYAENTVVVQDKTVDLGKLVQKNVQFLTRQLIVPEELVEPCTKLFDEKVDFVVIPAGINLHYGDAVLNEQLLEKVGISIYVYGNLTIPENTKMEELVHKIKKLFVKGTVILKKEQEAGFQKLNVEYGQLEFRWEGRIIENRLNVRIDSALLEGSPNKVLVRNTATVKISPDVPPELILDYLRIENCAKVSCTQEQESAISAIAKNVAKIGESGEEDIPGIGGIKDLLSTKMINADSYIM